MKRALCILMVFLMVMGSLVSLNGCNTTKKTDESVNSADSAVSTAAEKTEDLVVCVGPYPDSIDPALNSTVDGATYIIHTFAGLVGFKQNSEGKLELFADCAKSLPTAKARDDGMVEYVFELKDNLKWSDGTDLTAKDFVYAWNRAVDPKTAADYGYMFDVIDGYDKVVAGDAGAKLNVTASDDGKSLTIVCPVDAPYFLELCAFPAYMPVKQSVVEGNESWATTAATYIGNGPYKVTQFDQSQIVMEKNEYYANKDSVVTNKIIFPFNDDDGSLLANYKNGSYMFIDTVPNDEIDTLKTEYKDEFHVEGQLGTYYVSFNVNDTALSAFTQEEKAKIRTAMSLLIDRNYIVKEIGKAGQVPAAGFVAMGLTEPDGKEYISKNGFNHDGKGYFSVAEADYASNCDKAVALFKEVATSSGKFTVGADNKLVDFPELTYITNPGTGHEAIATNLQGVFGNYGITMKIEVQEWSVFVNTRKDGNYSVSRNGWLGDYNDPISFLDMWTTGSGNNDCQFGKGEHATYAAFTYKGETGKTWAESYDKLIQEVKSTKDQTARFDLMHQAEDVLMTSGAICPIYYYTDIYMCNKNITGFFASPLGFKYFMYASIPATK